jgi:hypothetical protein
LSQIPTLISSILQSIPNISSRNPQSRASLVRTYPLSPIFAPPFPGCSFFPISSNLSSISPAFPTPISAEIPKSVHFRLPSF